MGTGGSFPGGKARPGRDADLSPHLVPRSRMSRNYIPLPPSAIMACSVTTLLFFCYLDNHHRYENYLSFFDTVDQHQDYRQPSGMLKSTYTKLLIIQFSPAPWDFVSLIVFPVSLQPVLQPCPPLYWGFLITHNHTHAVGFLWTSDQLLAEASTYTGQHTHKQGTNIYAVNGIRTRDSSNRAAEGLHLRPRGHRDRLFLLLDPNIINNTLDPIVYFSAHKSPLSCPLCPLILSLIIHINSFHFLYACISCISHFH
jgi:hypothetical protein